MKTRIILLSTLLFTVLAFSQKKWTLKECVDYAIKNNISIKTNKLNLDLASKDVEIAKGEFLPSLGASISNNITLGLSTGGDNTRSSADRYSFSPNLNANGTIFNGFRNLNSYRQAKLGVKSSMLDLKIIENDISLQVVDTYLNVLFAKENLEVAKVQSEISTKQINRAKAQFEAGAIPKGDLLNIQSTAANDIQNVVTQENGLNIALLRLSQLLQVSYDEFNVATLNVDSPSLALLYTTSSEVYLKALNNRPEIKKAKLSIDNANFAYKIAKGAYLPTLSYSLSAGSFYNTVFGQPDVRPMTTAILNPDGTPVLDSNGRPTSRTEIVPFGFYKQLDEQLSYGVGFNLNIPIFNRFQIKNRVAKSIINKEQAELSLESEKLRLQQTIEQAFLDSKAAAKTFEAAQVSLDAQKEAFKNAQASLDYGAMTQFDYDQVRNRLVNAESTLIRAKYDYVFKTKVLKFYYGESILD